MDGEREREFSIVRPKPSLQRSYFPNLCLRWIGCCRHPAGRLFDRQFSRIAADFILLPGGLNLWTRAGFLNSALY